MKETGNREGRHGGVSRRRRDATDGIVGTVAIGDDWRRGQEATVDSVDARYNAD